MNYEEISLKGFIDEMEDVSEGPHSRKFCFVLGAGASRTSGIKSGQELVDIWDKELVNRNNIEYSRWKNELEITEENKYSFYSHYYEKRYKRNPSDGYNYLEKLMEHAKPSSGYIMLAYLLSNTSNNVVITTNFDHLIEDAIHYYNQIIPLVIGHESLAHYVVKKIKRPTIVKIHRDLLFDPANTVNQVESLHDNWKKALGNIFSEYHPIFIGYAGNDNSLMDYLILNSEKFASGEWCCPYWMLYGNDKIDAKISEILHKSTGYFIRHSGFDEVLYLMGAAFGYKIPSKDIFIGDAEKRYVMLSDAIDAFTDSLSRDKKSFSGASVSDINQAVQQITDGAALQQMYRKAIGLYDENKYDEALLELHELIKLKPDNARYQSILGDTLREMERYDEALAANQRAVELEPNDADYQNSLGKTLRMMRRYNEALAANQKAIELKPDNAWYLYHLGQIFSDMKRYDEALDANQKAMKLDPDQEFFTNSRGIILREMERYDEALAANQTAVKLDPDNAWYHCSLGDTLHIMKRYDEALAAKQKAVELKPDDTYYKDSLGDTLNEMK